MRYEGGIFRLDNEWVDDDVLLKIVGATFNVDILNFPTTMTIVLRDGILYGVFDIPTSLPEDSLYLEVGFNADMIEGGDVIKINWVESVKLVAHHADKDIPKVRLINV